MEELGNQPVKLWLEGRDLTIWGSNPGPCQQKTEILPTARENEPRSMWLKGKDLTDCVRDRTQDLVVRR